jgi:polyisoprenoid-binding protein YceI
MGGAGSSIARAAIETYTVDASHSHVGFSIAHFFSRVPGRFSGIEGTITLDPDDLSGGSVSVVIDAASIDTAEADRDGHLRSVDFLDVANHPRITFESSEVRSSGENRAMIDGTLTLKGVSMPVTLEIEFLGSGPDLWGGHRSGFEARTTINRQDFGMTWNRVLDSGGVMLGDEVSILINIEGLRQDAAAEEEPPAEGEAEAPAEDEAADPGVAEPAQQ